MTLDYVVQMMDGTGEWTDIGAFAYEEFADDYQTLLEFDIPDRGFRIVKRDKDGNDTTPLLGRIIH